MERTFSKIPDVDTIIASKLDDKSLLQFCKTSKYGSELCKNQNFWMKRMEDKYPEAVEYKSPNRTWKNYYLDIIYYLYKYGRNIDGALVEASKKGRMDIVKYLIKRGATDISGGFRAAILNGYKDLVDYFIEQAKIMGEEWDDYDWNYGLIHAAIGGHKDLIDYFIKLGATNYTSALLQAAYNGHYKLVDYLLPLVTELYDLRHVTNNLRNNGKIEMAEYIEESPHFKFVLQNP